MTRRTRQFAWFTGIWALSVAALGVVAMAIRAVIGT